MEFDFQSSLLETPSLMTPNIEVTAPPIKSVFNKASVDISHIKNASSMSNSSSSLSLLSTLEISSSVSSADAKVSKIQDELKQSLNEPRKPTPSPFQKITSSHAFNLEKPITTFPNDDQTPMEVPSTADVSVLFSHHLFASVFWMISHIYLYLGRYRIRSINECESSTIFSESINE